MFSLGLSSRASTSTPPATKQQAPKRVIRATQDYIARDSAELTFKRDDFFYVLSTPHSDDQWYEVTNPLSGERGLVPAACFEVMESRQERINRINRSGSTASSADGNSRASLGIPRSVPSSNSSSSAAAGSQQRSVSRSLSSKQRRISGKASPLLSQSPVPTEPIPVMPLRTRTTSIQQNHQRQQSPTANSYGAAPMPSVIELHARALYDFDSANGNELTIREGDDLVIVAQSTSDWLIARPAMQEKMAGLVPASYVQLRDNTTGAHVTDLRGHLSRYNMRLRSASEWERHQRELWAARASVHSTASISSDLVIVSSQEFGLGSGHARMHSGSSASGSFCDRPPTPSSSGGSITPVVSAMSHSSRNRALTASSSTTGSIAEHSSFRDLRKSRQPSGSGAMNFTPNENFPRFHKDEISRVGVPSFICKDGAYLFQVSLVFYTGDERNVYRTYEDFVSCRNELHEAFPAETASLKLARFSVHSSSMLYLNDSIAERRRAELHTYVRGLVETPAVIVEGPVVQRLFGSRVHHVPERLTTPDRGMHRALRSNTTGSRHTPSHSTDSNMDMQLTPASASSADTVVDVAHMDYTKAFGAMSLGKGPDGMRRPMTDIPPMPAEPRATSTEPKQGMQRLSHRPSISGLASNGTVKVKVRLGDDMVALRLPSELTLSELKARIASKLSNEDSSFSQIAYVAPSGESAPLSSDKDWATALLVTNYKPILTIVR
ncbi:bud emergence protein 1 [Coemansia sp. Benny D115]|nr:bud emergence protein 1 [Coemansia sp. Benny D115]